MLLSSNGDAAFLQNVISMGRERIIKNWEAMGLHLSDEKIEIVFSFIISGSVAIMRTWAAGDMRVPPHEIADLINRLTLGAINGVCD